MRKIYILMIAVLAMVYRVPIDQGRPAGQMFGPGLRKGARESVQMAVTGMVLLMTLFAVLGTLLVVGREVRESQALWWAMGATTIWALAHGAFVFGVFMAASRDALKNGNDADQRRYEALERIRKPVVGTPSGQAYAGGQITQAPPDFYLLGYFDPVMLQAMINQTPVPEGHIGFSFTTTDTHGTPIYGKLPLLPVPGDDTTSVQECIADSNDAPIPGTVQDVYDINGVKYVHTSAMGAPIDMVLHCPACGLQHIDKPNCFSDDAAPCDPPNSEMAPEDAEKCKRLLADYEAQWTNPPHRSHLCLGCGYVWRPADVPTNGVHSISTVGKNDSPVGTAPPPPEDVAPQVSEDTKLLDYLRHAACDLRCYALDAGGEDADVRWVVVEHHLDAPYERTIGRSYNDDPRTAIRAAMHSPTTGTRIPDAPTQAGEQVEPVADYPHAQMDALALARYKVVPSDQSMHWRHAVVAGDGQQHLYSGSEVDCQNMARKFAGAFLDGAFTLHQRYTAPQPAEMQADPVSDAQIKDVFIANGFTIKDGLTDLKPYVYQAARALLQLAAPQVQPVPDALCDDAPLVDLVVRLSAELRGVDPDNGMANKAMAILDERVLSHKAKEDAYDRVFAKLSAMTPVELAERLKKYEKDPFVATLRTLAQQDEAHATHTGAIVPRHWGLPLKWREDFDCHKANVDAADEPTNMTPRAYALSVLNLLQADLARKERYQDHNPGHSLSCLYNYMLQRTGLTDSRTARVVFFDQFPEYHMAMGAIENKQAECPVIDLCDCPICFKDGIHTPEYLLLAPGDDGRVPSVSGRSMARINRGLTMLMEKGVEITDFKGMQTVREMRDAIQTIIDTISIRGGELNDDTPITMYGWDTENLQHMANALRKDGFIAPWEFIQTVIDCTPSVRPPGETLGRRIHQHFTNAIECNRLQNRENEPHTLPELEWLAQGFAMAYGIPPGDTRLVALAATLPYLSKEHRIEPRDRSDETQA